jgi:hypothetical protein
LFVDDTLYKVLSNGPYNTIFVETFDSSIGGNNNYLLGDVLPYLEAFHSSRLMSPHLWKTTLSVALNILVKTIPNIRHYLMILVIIVMFHII